MLDVREVRENAGDVLGDLAVGQTALTEEVPVHQVPNKRRSGWSEEIGTAAARDV
jgi:hypothetical protein